MLHSFNADAHAPAIAGGFDYCTSFGSIGSPACVSSWKATPYSLSELASALPAKYDAKLYAARTSAYVDACGAHCAAEERIFNGKEWCEWTQANWHLPLGTVMLYLCMIPLVRTAMERRGAPVPRSLITPVLFAWNAALALFSLVGFLQTGPYLVKALVAVGFRPTVCASGLWYGNGTNGAFVALFIYSKFFELFDTLWLLLKRRKVIFLQWWHHTTVLLYCWHAYASMVGHGLWFAAMNYAVHSLVRRWRSASNSAFFLFVFLAPRRRQTSFPFPRTTLRLARKLCR
jgi:hypothetical protein